MAPALGLGPEADFLGKPAVVSHFPIAQDQAQFGCRGVEACHHFIHIHWDAFFCKQLFQADALFRGVRMQRVCPPFYVKIIFFF